MEKIIQKIQELYGVLLNAIGAIEKERSAIVKRERTVEERQQFLINRETDLDAREVEIKKVENIVALAKSAKQMIADAKKEFDRLDALKADHEKKIREDGVRMGQVKQNLDQRKEALALGEADLKTRQDQLEKDKQNYKDEVLAEMLKKR